MLKDITLGQYFPGDTALHRLDPRTKTILVIVYIVALFLAVSYVSYAVLLAALAAAIAVSKVRPKVLLKSLKPILILMVLTAVLNLFYTRGTDVLVSFWIIWCLLT